MSYREDLGKTPTYGTKTKETFQLIKSNETLEAIKTASNTTNTTLKTIATNTTIKELKAPTGKVSLTSAGGVAVYTDSLPIPTLDDNNREGWLFDKIAIGTNKFNYYFYGKGNKSLTLGDLKSISAIISIDTYGNTSDIPFFNVYTTKDAGANAGSWYKSRITYTLTADETILLGERVEMYGGLKPLTHTGARQVEFNNKITVGTADPTEEIYTISIGSDSGAGITCRILVEELGLDFFENENKIETRLKLT